MLGYEVIGIAPLGSVAVQAVAPDVPGLLIDATKVPTRQTVVFEGSKRVVEFEGSKRIVEFE